MRRYTAWESADPEFGERLETETRSGADAAEKLAAKEEKPSQQYMITVEREDGERARFMMTPYTVTFIQRDESDERVSKRRPPSRTP